MTIERVIVKNYRVLHRADISLNPDLNIIVGDNESGKSTLLEAINLALRFQLNGRLLTYDMHPFLMNIEESRDYIQALCAGESLDPPEILIELYLADEDRFARLKGRNNSQNDNVPGIYLKLALDEDLLEEYNQYVASPENVTSVPIEFYKARWRAFSDKDINPRKLPLKSAIIDPSSIANTHSANRFVLETIENYLDSKERVALSLSYRGMKDQFLNEKSVTKINEKLAEQTGLISDKPLSVALDVTSKTNWEATVIPHLARIPVALVGKGEQNCVKVKLAIGSEESCEVLLIEEPENHLTHANLNKLIKHMSDNSTGHQLILTTHSSFVLNKLGVDHVHMFTPKGVMKLDSLEASTMNYFKKLSGYDTLRMILSKRTILVEGPSDELIVQKAYHQTHGSLPIEDEVEVISVGSLAFKRFLQIADLLSIPTAVVTDNDGDPDAVDTKYADYSDHKTISICFDADPDSPTLEPQLIKSNGRQKLNQMLGKNFEDDKSLYEYMRRNKTDVALTIFETSEPFDIPDYIQRAIAQ